MLRSAAKNFKSVAVITDVADYALVQQEISENGDSTIETRKKLAGKVFNLTSAYDAAISKMLLEEEYPTYLSASYKKFQICVTAKILTNRLLITFQHLKMEQ
jgi:phosphoribosylaminoimidazolecarboxamide formyltransferase/IMP cyclohydrolase